VPDVHESYNALRRLSASGAPSEQISDCLRAIYVESTTVLDGARDRELNTSITGKDYFAFDIAGKRSRAVNVDLFRATSVEPDSVLRALERGEVTQIPADAINRAVYKMAMAFCAAIDLTRPNDRKTQGTYFEHVVAHLVALRFGVPAVRNLDVLNLDMRAELPTDLTFDLGRGKPKFHVPVKTSTRERVIQVWAHQRIIDGVFGVGRFLGLLVCLAETHVAERTIHVQEICLIDQWRIYQLFIAQLKRVYYLDVPVAYSNLAAEFPRIHVKTFGEFFHEADTLADDA